MAKKKVDEMTLMREEALRAGRVVVTKRTIDPKLKAQLLRNYGLVVKRGAS